MTFRFPLLGLLHPIEQYAGPAATALLASQRAVARQS